MTLKQNYRYLKKIFPIIIVVFLTIMLAIKPEIYIKSVFDGILLFCTAVLPALFPFFFFTKALTALGAADSFSKVFKKPLKKLYNAPPISAYIFVMSILSGYPVGAKLLSDCYKNGLIDAREARTVAAFTSTSGPLFIIGTVAVNMFHDKGLGFLIMLCHFAAALINGFIYRPYKKSSDITSITPLPSVQDNLMSNLIYDAIISVLCVGGYIAIFSMIIDVFFNIGAMQIIAFLPSAFLNMIGVDAQLAKGIAAGLFEVTRGCLEISACSAKASITLPILCGIISFGGASIFAQSLNFITDCKISTMRFIAMKTTHAVIAVALASLVSLML